MSGQPSQLLVDLLGRRMLNVSGKLEGLNHMQLDHVQVGYMNKVEEFWKDVQTTFLRKRNLSYVHDRSYVDQISGNKVKKLQKSNVGCCLSVN